MVRSVPKLGVNIDHVATLRQARGIGRPDLVAAAGIVERAGADGITVHLREDRRHVNDRDVRLLRGALTTRMNLEMSVARDVVSVALEVRPDEACIVPEKRQELTTEGGLNLGSRFPELKKVIARLKDRGIVVSLFIDPSEKDVELAAKAGADCVELHTGRYSLAAGRARRTAELKKIERAGAAARGLGLRLNAGHGLDYDNVIPVAGIEGMDTLNIGFSIVARSVAVGLPQAVREMKKLIK